MSDDGRVEGNGEGPGADHVESDRDGGTDAEGVSRSARSGPRGRRSLPVLQEGGGPAGAEVSAFGAASGRVLDRRTMIKLMAAAAAVPALGGCEPGDELPEGGLTPAANRSAAATNPLAAGTPWDPDLIAPTVPWEGILTDDELETLAVLCDVIIPADEHSPAASSVGAHEFVDEYVSAPYPSMARDLILVRGGLVWLDTEAEVRFGEGSRFRTLTDEQKRAICDDIRSTEAAEPRFRAAARFFDRVRDLTATAFYTTPEGMEDIGYVGNRPIPGPWPAPPPEVLRHLGLEGVSW